MMYSRKNVVVIVIVVDVVVVVVVVVTIIFSLSPPSLPLLLYTAPHVALGNMKLAR